jgi:nucleoside-diphosphate-sugar epimerase
MEELKRARAFVTGATGFVGGALCKTLLASGAIVTALVRRNSRTGPIDELGVRKVVGDVRDKASLASALSDVDVLYHIAAAFRQARLSDKDYHDINVTGTRNVMESAGEHGVRRVVHCSTIGVHGDTGRTPANEDSPFAPPDYYCQSKLEGELLARELFGTLDMEGVVFRPVGVYGPGDTRFLKLFRSIRRGHFRMIGSGETLYHLTYIDDLCRGIRICGEHKDAVGEVFILGGEDSVTLNQWAAEIAKVVGGRVPRGHVPLAPVMLAARLCESACRPLKIEPPLYRRRIEFFSKDRAVDISKARRILGYVPRVSLADGLRRTAAWYRERGYL